MLHLLHDSFAKAKTFSFFFPSAILIAMAGARYAISTFDITAESNMGPSGDEHLDGCSDATESAVAIEATHI